MSKQFVTFYVSWRDAARKPISWFADEVSYGRAASDALADKLNELADDGWIIDQIIPAASPNPRIAAAFTIIAFQ